MTSISFYTIAQTFSENLSLLLSLPVSIISPNHIALRQCLLVKLYLPHRPDACQVMQWRCRTCPHVSDVVPPASDGQVSSVSPSLSVPPTRPPLPASSRPATCQLMVIFILRLPDIIYLIKACNMSTHGYLYSQTPRYNIPHQGLQHVNSWLSLFSDSQI